MVRLHRPLTPQLAATTVAAVAMLAAPPALAQALNFGTDQRYCDTSTMSKILSTSKGNLIGSAAGAVGGGLVGSQFGKSSGKGLATVIGVVGGALAGGYVGRSMDQTDQNCVGQTLEHAPTAQPVAWQNPGSGSSYWVTPTRDIPGPNGQTCRDYVTDAVVDGKTEKVQNTACRQPNGDWVPVSQQDLRPLPAEQPRPQAAPVLSDDAVMKVQQRLREQGFYVRDNIDGHWGPRTAAALKNFQRSKGLNPTGQLDLSTLAALDLQSDAATH